jgi:predicted dehydrogenase
MRRDDPVRMGLVGLSGYAETVLASLIEAEELEHPPIKLAAVHAPDLALHDSIVGTLKQRGVELYDSYEGLLASRAEAVWLPVPIHLHAPFTIQALQAGKAVMCEKPAAGCVEDIDRMIGARDEAGLPVLIGYNHIPKPTTKQIKARLLDNRIGSIRSVTVAAASPRSNHYYQRNGWAGSFRRDGSWVMDSPVSNAMSHFVNLALFFMGPSLHAPAVPVSVEAELYRVNPIENYDTAAIRVVTDSGATCLILTTHACSEVVPASVRIEGTLGAVSWSNERITIQNGSDTETLTPEKNFLSDCITALASATRGDELDPDRISPSLEIARAPVLVANAASEAVRVAGVDGSMISKIQGGDGGVIHALKGIEHMIRHCQSNNLLFHESGMVKWTQPPGYRGDLDGYKRFAGPLR